MVVTKRVVKRVVKQNSTQEVNNPVVYRGDSGGAFENGIHLDFANSIFYTKAAGQDANIKSRLQDLFTFTGGNQSMYRGSNGLLKQSVTNTPRIEYDSTGACLGLLMEASRTNLCLQSQTLDNASWGKTLATVTADATSAPDGTNTADKIVEDNSVTSSHLITQAISFTAGTTYTMSMYVKAAERTWLLIAFGAAAFTVQCGMHFNVGSGTLGTVLNSATATITPYANGWYKCTVTSTATTTAAANIQVILATGDLGTVYTGNGTSGLHMWGAQVEAGAFASSYIPTTTVSVARTADTCVRTVGTEFVQNTGTMFANYRTGLAVSGGNQFITRFSDNTSNNHVCLMISATGTAQLSTASGGVFDGLATAPTNVTANTTIKQAVAWATNDLAISRDSGVVAADTTATIPGALTQLNIGSDHIGANRSDQIYLVKFDYWPVRYSDTNLEAISGDGYEQGVHLDFTTDTYWVKSATTNVRTNGASVTDLFTFTGGNQSMYVGPTGLLVQSVTNTPRIEYDPITLAKRGLLLEATRTNILYHSENFGTGWTTQGGTRTVESTDMKGTANAMNTLTESTATTAHRFFNNAVGFATTAAAWTFSCYLRAGTRRWVQFGVTVGSDGLWATIDTSTWTFSQNSTAVGGYTAGSQGIERLASDIYRVWISGTLTVNNVVPVISGSNVATPGSIAGPYTYTGDGVSTIIASGAQLELGAFPSSYIPTTTAGVARTADVCSRAAGSEYLATNGGTISVQGRTQLGQDAGNQFFSCLATGADTVLILRPANSNLMRFNVFTGGVAQGPCDNTIVNGATFKEVVAWNTNDMAASFNGGAVVTDNTVTIGTFGTFFIGSENTPTLQTNAWISKFDYTPGRKSNGRLVALSA